ncbi:hypothetical protein [Rhodococcus zopfii]|uniref:hypothetical protein n=1 Tax=Rhodococcus zopfii TaxID=43772 RepID=UPI0035293A97
MSGRTARHPDAAYRQDPVGTGSSAESGIVDSGYRLDVVAPGTADVSDPRPMQILGVGTAISNRR